MMYPQFSSEEWAKRYQLSVNPIRCPKCEFMQTPSIPFAYGKWRGLIAELHVCGPNYQASVARQFDEEWNKAIEKLFESMKQRYAEGVSCKPHRWQTMEFTHGEVCVACGMTRARTEELNTNG